MSAPHSVAMQSLQRGERGEAARRALGGALGGGQVGEPDDAGIFEIEVEAPDREAALRRVWDAVAAAGVDDEIAFAEHPDLPGHWRELGTEPRA